jgi:hypothetical protein
VHLEVKSSNLTLIDLKVGGICAVNKGTVQQCKVEDSTIYGVTSNQHGELLVSDSINIYSYVGGIVGYNSGNAKVISCSTTNSTVTLKTEQESQYVYAPLVPSILKVYGYYYYGAIMGANGGNGIISGSSVSKNTVSFYISAWNWTNDYNLLHSYRNDTVTSPTSKSGDWVNYWEKHEYTVS